VTEAGVLWVDVLLPAGDPLWDDDVARAALWLGQAWADALVRLGVGNATVWNEQMLTNEWSSRVCFAGVAPGEVLLNGKKAVGVSQRRTRHAALFQTAVLLEWQPADLIRLLALDPESRRRAAAELAFAAVAVPAPPADLLDAFLAALPA
jgi:lipoate-protein ligase A